MPGWRVVIDTQRSSVQIIAPGPEVLHTGGLVCEPSWYQLVAERQIDGRGLVIITGAAAPTEEAALEMISAGLASWLRSAVEFAF